MPSWILVALCLALPLGAAGGALAAPGPGLAPAEGDEKTGEPGGKAPEAQKGKTPPKAAGGETQPGGEPSKVAPQPGQKAPRPTPQFKVPQALEKFQSGLQKMQEGDYTEARNILTGCLKDATTPADKKLIQAAIDDTRLGTEIEGARRMVERKDHRKAITKVDKALKSYPDSELRPMAEKFIQETEEVVYLILDDFEPGSSLQTQAPVAPQTATTKDLLNNRWRKNQSFNSDPKFVRHGKGSMKWRVGGDYYSTGFYRYWYEGYGYQSLELKNPITSWKHFVFWVHLPEADEGALRVTLSPDIDMGVVGSLYTKKFYDFRGKKGWQEVRLDLRNDFGGTAIVKLEDIRYVRIDYMHLKVRTIYVDFVHFE